MKKRLPPIALALLLLSVLCASADAMLVPIYRNALDTTAERREVLRLSGRDCARSGSGGTLRIVVGERTEECLLRTPVAGRNLELATTARLLTATPRAVARRAFVGLVLRAGGGAKYELRVFPRQRKAQLVKVTGSRIEYLSVEKGIGAISGVGRPNVLRLRAEGTGANVGLRAYLGRTPVTRATDRGARLGGEFSAISVGAARNGHRAVAEFDAIVARVPVRF